MLRDSARVAEILGATCCVLGARTARTAFALGWIAGLLAVSIVVVLAAEASIAEAGLDQADEAIAIVVFVALGPTAVAGAVLVRRARRPVSQTGQW